MSIYLNLVFLTVVTCVSFTLSAYTLSRIYDLICLVSPQLKDCTQLTWLHEPEGWWISTALVICYFMIGKVLPTRPLRWLGWFSGLWIGYITIWLLLAGPLHLLEITLSSLSLPTPPPLLVAQFTLPYAQVKIDDQRSPGPISNC